MIDPFSSDRVNGLVPWEAPRLTVLDVGHTTLKLSAANEMTTINPSGDTISFGPS